MRHGEDYAREIEAELDEWPENDRDHWPPCGSSQFMAALDRDVRPFWIEDMDPDAVEKIGSSMHHWPFCDMESVQALVADVTVYHEDREPEEETYGMTNADLMDPTLFGRPSL